jgi:deleted-in-malignant-brain-tumors protein 1
MLGDPHIITLDGYQYTFNGKGEFILSETMDGSFILQGRMTEPPLPIDSESVNNTRRGTSFVALAIEDEDSPTVQLEVDNNELIVLVDGERVDFSAVPEQRLSNITINDVGNSTYSVRFGSGASLIASKINNILTNILITLPEHYCNITRGLLGQYNGDPNDDLLPRNTTTPLPSNATTEDIHHNFGITCK